MRFAFATFAATLGLPASLPVATAQSGELDVPSELPITTTDVFVQSGEVSETTAIIMARCNSEEDSEAVLTLDGSVVQTITVTSETDFTVSYEVADLSPNTMHTYSVVCTPAGGEAMSSMEASFKTAPAAEEETDISFVWVADLAGQGWGRNPDFEVTTVDGDTIKGGYVVFEVMEKLAPDFALFQGDMIYADNAIPPTKPVPEAMGLNSGAWINNPSKDFVAVTLDDFRMNWKYNFGDEKMQSFLSKVPIYVQWDDHEVTNNWWPDEVFGPGLYENGTEANMLYQNSLQAMYEMNPIIEGQSLYRKQRFGKHLEIFFPDYRSFRGPNPDNDDPDGAAMMGPEQLEWLKTSLAESTATWKIISSHDPLGIVTGSSEDWDSFGQEDPRILGRELELQDLLSHIKTSDIKGVISLTTDVHFTAHVNMHPDRAEGNWTDFNPLDEFVVGPIHAGSFGPNFMDTSFGAKYMYGESILCPKPALCVPWLCLF